MKPSIVLRVYKFLFKLSQLLRHHPDGNLPQKVFLRFSLVYDDDATNKFQLFCLYLFLLIIILLVLCFRRECELDTADNEKHKVIFQTHTLLPPISTFYFKIFSCRKRRNKKIISFYDFFSCFIVSCNNRWWYAAAPCPHSGNCSWSSYVRVEEKSDC